MTTIVPIVEGYGEVSAVPELLRRILYHHTAYDIQVDQPVRQPRSRLIKETSFKAALGVARKQPDCSAIVVILDADDDCPAELGPQLRQWGQESLGDFPVSVVTAKREYEAWLIASAEALRDKGRIEPQMTLPEDVETIRDAKGWLSDHMPGNLKYSETSDQAAFTALMDFKLSHQRSDSFRKLWKDLANLVLGLKGSIVEFET